MSCEKIYTPIPNDCTVPCTRILTINGVSYDLSQDRTWTVGGTGTGTVTSVQLAAGTGISLSGTNPITTSGTITIVNSAPDQTVVLTAGTGISISGTYPNFTIAATSSGSGTVTSISTTGLISGGPITTTGTITTLMNTNKLVGRSSAGAGIMEEITVGSGLTLSGGTLTNTATPTPTGYYGSFIDKTTQSATANNLGVAMMYSGNLLYNGISITNNGTGDPTRITFAYTGIYNLQFSCQFQNLSNSPQDVYIWLKKNGTDVVDTNSVIGLEPRKNPGDPYHIVAAWNFVLSIVGGDYYELYWATTDYVNVTMPYYNSTSFAPLTPSVILTITQQSGIMAGTGITAINSLTDAVQTMTTGISGTDFAISSATGTHTFNLPIASATNTGKLSSTDWSTFNAKQAAGNYITALTGDVTASGPGSVAATVKSNLRIGSISLTITGSGTVPSTGAFGAVIVPYAGTITDWYLVTTGDSPSGSIVIDVKRSGISIIGAGNKPTLSSGTSANAAVSAWTSTAISANDAFTFNIDSVSSLTGVTLMIKITKT